MRPAVLYGPCLGGLNLDSLCDQLSMEDIESKKRNNGFISGALATMLCVAGVGVGREGWRNMLTNP